MCLLCRKLSGFYSDATVQCLWQPKVRGENRGLQNWLLKDRKEWSAPWKEDSSKPCHGPNPCHHHPTLSARQQFFTVLPTLWAATQCISSGSITQHSQHNIHQRQGLLPTVHFYWLCPFQMFWWCGAMDGTVLQVCVDVNSKGDRFNMHSTQQ